MKNEPNQLANEIVIFGAMGDLAKRKLLPSLYQLVVSKTLSNEFRIVNIARDDLSQQAYRELVKCNLESFIDEPLCEASLEQFLQQITYQKIELQEPDNYAKLAEVLADNTVRIYYFSTPPRLYGDIADGLNAAGLINATDRVVMEKPIGNCLSSSIAVNEQVSKYFDEKQIYRIDHYLGKETVLNLLALRFANSLFTNNWDRDCIDHVQITVAESVGIEGRWSFYDTAGQMRDMVQSHLLQVLSLLAMEPPTDLHADSIRDEKLKVLKALKPITQDNINEATVRGQYSDGYLAGESVSGYLNEEEANANSTTETFVAIKAEIENWRWAGVPFYLRTGKRMPKKQSEVVIYFKQQPHNIFNDSYRDLPANKLTIRLQPDEGVELEVMNKIPGLSSHMQVHNNKLDLSFSTAYGNERVSDAYERLISEVINGNQSLFVRRDEIEAAWQWTDSIIAAWQGSYDAPKPYPAGSWGPTSAIALIAKDGRNWVE